MDDNVSDDSLPIDLAAAAAAAEGRIYDYSNQHSACSGIVFAVRVDYIYNDVDVETKRSDICNCFDIDLCYSCHIASFDSFDVFVMVEKE